MELCFGYVCVYQFKCTSIRISYMCTCMGVGVHVFVYMCVYIFMLCYVIMLCCYVMLCCVMYVLACISVS